MNEFDIIQRHFAALTPPGPGALLGIGDDGALLSVAAGSELAVSTDALVAGTHFFPDADPFDIGHKSLAVNLSDMAAMGAAPRWMTLALTLSEAQLDDAWLSGFSRGLAELARRHGVALVGGDLSRGPLAVVIQLLGECPEGQAIRRDGARPGDAVFLSGELGAASCALALLKAGRAPPPPDFSARLRRPEPRLELGVSLRGLASAMIDVSDGLLADLGRLTQASGVGAAINIDAIPVSPQLRALAVPGDPWRHALAGGDDYELCFTAPERNWRKLQALGRPVHRIGAIVAAPGLRCHREDGAEYRPAFAAGHDHFSA